jgi:hypothetical protein
MTSWLHSIGQQLEEKIQKVKTGSLGIGIGGAQGDTKLSPRGGGRGSTIPSSATTTIHIPSYPSGTSSTPCNLSSRGSNSNSSSFSDNGGGGGGGSGGGGLPSPSPPLLPLHSAVKSPSSTSTLSTLLSFASIGGTSSSRSHVDEESREGHESSSSTTTYSNGIATPTAWLTIHLIQAKDLIVADRSGTSDPYVIFRVKGFIFFHHHHPSSSSFLLLLLLFFLPLLLLPPFFFQSHFIHLLSTHQLTITLYFPFSFLHP